MATLENGNSLEYGSGASNFGASPEQLTDEERQVLNILRQTGWGECNVKVQKGKPVLVEVKRTVKLGV